MSEPITSSRARPPDHTDPSTCPGVRQGALPRRRTLITASHFFQTKNEIIYQTGTLLLYLMPLNMLANPSGRNGRILTLAGNLPPPRIHCRVFRAEIPSRRPTIVENIRFNSANLSVPNNDSKTITIVILGRGGRHILSNNPHLNIPVSHPFNVRVVTFNP